MNNKEDLTKLFEIVLLAKAKVSDCIGNDNLGRIAGNILLADGALQEAEKLIKKMCKDIDDNIEVLEVLAGKKSLKTFLDEIHNEIKNDNPENEIYKENF